MIDKNSMVIYYLLIAIFVVTIMIIYKLRNKEKRSHAWRRKSANRAFELTKSFQNEAQIMVYLRKVDPFVFEEILLLAISQNKNCKIVKNSRYTGDGGVDGRFIYVENGKEYLYLVQAKRYSFHIKNQDLLALSKKVTEEKAYRGLFIHTGRSGKGAWRNVFQSNNIEIISGNKLLKLMKDGFTHKRMP